MINRFRVILNQSISGDSGRISSKRIPQLEVGACSRLAAVSRRGTNPKTLLSFLENSPGEFPKDSIQATSAARRASRTRTGPFPSVDPTGSDGIHVLRKASARLRVPREQRSMVGAPASSAWRWSGTLLVVEQGGARVRAHGAQLKPLMGGQGFNLGSFHCPLRLLCLSGTPGIALRSGTRGFRRSRRRQP